MREEPATHAVSADDRGGQTIENRGPLTRKCREMIDDETVATAKAFIARKNKADKPR